MSWIVNISEKAPVKVNKVKSAANVANVVSTADNSQAGKQNTQTGKEDNIHKDKKMSLL